MELVRDMQVDVIGLLESDLHRFVYGNRDLTRVMAEELGYVSHGVSYLSPHGYPPSSAPCDQMKLIYSMSISARDRTSIPGEPPCCRSSPSSTRHTTSFRHRTASWLPLYTPRSTYTGRESTYGSRTMARRKMRLTGNCRRPRSPSTSPRRKTSRRSFWATSSRILGTSDHGRTRF